MAEHAAPMVEAGQHETLTGGTNTEYTLPIRYTITNMVIWWLVVSILGALLMLPSRETWYTMGWLAIGAALLVGGIVALGGGRREHIHPIWGALLALLALVAGWLWDAGGLEVVYRPLPWLFLAKIYTAVVVLGWLLPLGILAFSFAAQTADRNWVPTRDKLPGEWGPMWPWQAGRMLLPKGKYEEEEPPAPQPEEVPVRVVVSRIDREPHLQQLAHGVNRSNGLGGSGRQTEITALPSEFEAVRQRLLFGDGDLRAEGKLQETELGGSRIFSTERFREWRREMLDAGYAMRENEHPKAAFVLTEDGRRFLEKRGWNGGGPPLSNG